MMCVGEEVCKSMQIRAKVIVLGGKEGLECEVCVDGWDVIGACISI